MNRVLLTGIIAMLTFLSCTENKPAKVETPPTEPQVKTAAQLDPKAQKLEDLKKASPSDLSELQKLLPEVMGGIKRTKFSMTSNLGNAHAQADYEKNRNTFYHLILYDCTGEQGAKLYDNSFLSYLDKNEENAEGYRKTVDFYGIKAVERYEAANKVTTLSFLANDKILVVLSGKNIPSEKVEEAARELSVKPS